MESSMNELNLKQASSLERMIQQQVVERGIRDDRVLAALRSVPRDPFFNEDTRGDAYADRPAPIGYGQTISTLHIVALMTNRLDIQAGHRVLELGTGSGYQTAVLAKLATEVWTIERVKPLLDDAFERLMSLGVRNVHYRYGDGTIGWPEAAPFDRLLIAAGAPELPRELLMSQLKDGGLAVLPIGPLHKQMLVEVRREGSRLQISDICQCRFVKLIGQEGWGKE
jgi:protein-L-isoaspartate(D-aspartate) O-methyltransferase